MKLNLPNNFIWGTATAAHQVEGDNKNSDFWFLENFKNTTFAEPSGIASVSYTHLTLPTKRIV